MEWGSHPPPTAGILRIEENRVSVPPHPNVNDKQQTGSDDHAGLMQNKVLQETVEKGTPPPPQKKQKTKTKQTSPVLVV